MPNPADEVTTVLRRKFDPTPEADAAFVIAVTDGPDAGGQFVIDGSSPSRVLVGSGPACELRLTDREVSRRHAAFEVVGPRLRITDLGSTNGMLVNGVDACDVFLHGGEIVRIGATALHVDRKAAAEPVALAARGSFGRVLGASTEMRRLYPLCERLAQSAVPVIIEGETGTGKEVLAEALHDQGPRASGPFIVFDCTQVPPNLVESEMFGHEQGAFTGAVSRRKGLFEQAHGGTILIDEIGDLDRALQPKLLRAIERSEIRRVGGDKWIRVDARVLAATRRNLDEEVQAGRFRDDLFHRLAVARIELPPLKRRRGDVAILVGQFLKELGGIEEMIAPDTLARWETYEWPGNVRELRNAVARTVALGELAALPVARGAGAMDEEVTSPDALQGAKPGDDFMTGVLDADLPLTTARERVADEFERRYVERILAKHGGNVAHAAAASGVARRHFQRLKARWR